MPKAKASHNRAIRQEALRDQLAEQCRVQHILENIGKLEDERIELDSNQIMRIKTANEQRLKLLGKYLPDLKATEVSGPDGKALTVEKIVRTIVDPGAT